MQGPRVSAKRESRRLAVPKRVPRGLPTSTSALAPSQPLPDAARHLSKTRIPHKLSHGLPLPAGRIPILSHAQKALHTCDQAALSAAPLDTCFPPRRSLLSPAPRPGLCPHGPDGRAESAGKPRGLCPGGRHSRGGEAMITPNIPCGCYGPGPGTQSGKHGSCPQKPEGQWSTVRGQKGRPAGVSAPGPPRRSQRAVPPGEMCPCALTRGTSHGRGPRSPPPSPVCREKRRRRALRGQRVTWQTHPAVSVDVARAGAGDRERP